MGYKDSQQGSLKTCGTEEILAVFSRHPDSAHKAHLLRPLPSSGRAVWLGSSRNLSSSLARFARFDRRGREEADVERSGAIVVRRGAIQACRARGARSRRTGAAGLSAAAQGRGG
jgi:sigma54-dependent transcription regulator